MGVTVFIGPKDWYKGQAGREGTDSQRLPSACPFGRDRTVHRVQLFTPECCWVLSTWPQALEYPSSVAKPVSAGHPGNPHRWGCVNCVGCGCREENVNGIKYSKYACDIESPLEFACWCWTATCHPGLFLRIWTCTPGLRREDEKRNLVSLPRFLDNGKDFF